MTNLKIKLWSRWLLSAGIVFTLSTALAYKGHPFGHEFEVEFSKQFLENGQLSLEKRDQFIERLEKKYSEVVGPRDQVTDEDHSLLITKYRNGKRSNKKIFKKIHKHDLAVALREALRLINTLDENTDLNEARQVAGLAWSLDHSVSIAGNLPPLSKVLYHIDSILFSTWSVSKRTSAQLESNNLWDKRAGQFLDENDISELLAQGADLSLFNPNPDSSFWQEPKSGRKGLDLFSESPLYSGLDIHFPKDKTYYYDKMKLSQSKPKMKVEAYDDEGNKFEYKVKFGQEIHSDPTVAALAKAVGFHADFAQLHKNIKIVFEDKSYDEMVADWESYYEPEGPFVNYPVEKMFSSPRTDAEGRQYVIANQALIEPKPDELVRIGPWAFKQPEMQSLRELRGLELFNMWVGNADVKEADNNRLILKEVQKDQYIPFLMNSDLGYSLGSLFGEKPTAFPKSIVKSKSRSKIKFQFLSFQKNSAQHKMTYYDAKWMARKIAKVSRKQIEFAFELGGWPQCIRPIYIEKLINSRNDLVIAFELENEFPLLPIDEKYLDIKLQKACENFSRIEEEYVTDFIFDAPWMTRFVGRAVKEKLKDGLTEVVNGFQRVSLHPNEVGVEEHFIAQVTVDLKRERIRNPKQKGINDKYLTKDSFELGLRLGYSFGAFADHKVTRKFTLVYPHRRKEWTEKDHGSIVDFFLYNKIKNLRLPENYVMITEDYADWRLGFRDEDFNVAASPGTEVGDSLVLLDRMVVDGRNPEKVYILKDRTSYFEMFAQAYMRFALIKFPFASWSHQNGMSDGILFQMDKAHFAPGSEAFEDLRNAVLSHDLSKINSLKLQPSSIENTFRNNKTGANLFFWFSRSQQRTDELSIKQENGEATHNFVQHDRSSESGWKWIDRGERIYYQVRSFANMHPKLSQPQYGLVVDVEIEDVDTFTRELEKEYLRFTNGLAIDQKPLINLTPNLNYSSNGRWGHLIHKITIEIYDEGLRNILNSDKNSFWQSAAQTINMDVDQFTSLFSGGKFIERKAGMRVFGKLKRAQKRRTQSAKAISLARVFEKAFYRVPDESLQPEMLQTLLRLAGPENHFIQAQINVPDHAEVDFIGGVEPLRRWGQKQDLGIRFILYRPEKADEVYYMLDPLF